MTLRKYDLVKAHFCLELLKLEFLKETFTGILNSNRYMETYIINIQSTNIYLTNISILKYQFESFKGISTSRIFDFKFEPKKKRNF